MKMNLSDYMELGVSKAHSVAELARIIGIAREHASAAKSMKKTLPLDAAVKLADYIGEDLRAVIAVNELATEKKPEKRAFWEHILDRQLGLLHMVLGGVVSCVVFRLIATSEKLIQLALLSS